MASRSTQSLFPRWRIPLAAGIIIIAALGAYRNSFSGPFIFDGKTSIAQNSNIRQLWPIWDIFPAEPGATVAGRPVLSLSFALNYQISGLKVWSYHAVNLAVHILAALTLFGIIRRTLLCEKLRPLFGQASFSLALICALIWMLHPLQTSSVTYIVQRAESLMGLFYLLSLYCAIRGFSSMKCWRWYTLAILACALGMGTKEVVVTAPLMMLLYDRIFVSRSLKEIFARRWGLYVGLVATWIIFCGLALSAPRGQSVSFGYPGLTWIEYAMTQCQIIVSSYLRLSFWPNPLVLDYGWPIVRSFGQVLPHASVLILLLTGSLLALRFFPAWGFLGVWFFFILAPSSSFVPIITEVAAEHRMYLPLAAIVTAVVLGGYLMLTHLARQRARLAQALGYILVGIVAIILATLTFNRNNDYATKLSIWDVTICQCPENFRAYFNRASIYLGKDDHDLAIRDYSKAIQLNIRFADAYNARGIAYSSKGEYDRAIRDFDKCIKLNPTEPTSYCNRAIAYSSQAKYSQAIRDFSKVVQLNPADAQAHYNRGLAYSRKGQLDQALRDLSQAIKLNPKHTKAHYHRGLAYKRMGQYGRAIQDFDQAIKANPRDARAYNNRGIAYSSNGKLDHAIRNFSKVIELSPADAEAYSNRGLAYLSKEEPDQAISDLNQAIALNPEYSKAYNNRGLAYLSKTQLDQAIGDFDQAIKSNPKYIKAYCSRGLAYKRKGEYNLAIRDFEKAAQLALASGNRMLAKTIQDQLDLYKANRP